MSRSPKMIVSNRGPVSFEHDGSGGLTVTKTGGGLASALRPLLDQGATWLAMAMSPADRLAASTPGMVPDDVRLVVVEADVYDLAYNRVANETLWFAHHGMLDPTHAATEEWRRSWAGFETYNTKMAEAIIEVAPRGATVLVQDYHLCLVAPVVRPQRPDLGLVHFSHTPFAGPDELAIPEDIQHRLISSMASFHACGFHSLRWRQAFLDNCAAHGVASPNTFVSPLAPDLRGVTAVADSPASAAASTRLDEVVGQRQLIVRVDRIEPTKNIIAGFEAFDLFLRTNQDRHDHVVFAAYVYPSRETLTRYRSLNEEIVELVAGINGKYRTQSWTPIHLDTTDNLPGAMAALRRYDCLLVNPTRDGLNLVAMEGPILNERAGRLVLSTEAGAHDRLGEHSVSIDPADVTATARALEIALNTAPAEAKERSFALRSVIDARTPETWLADQLRHAPKP